MCTIVNILKFILFTRTLQENMASTQNTATQVQKTIPSSGILSDQLFYHSFVDNKGKPGTAACAFSYNRDTHELCYGASIFRANPNAKTSKPTQKDKSGISHTAQQRLKVRPVVLTHPEFENYTSVAQFRSYLYGELEKFKLCGKRI